MTGARGQRFARFPVSIVVDGARAASELRILRQALVQKHQDYLQAVEVHKKTVELLLASEQHRLQQARYIRHLEGLQ